MSPDDAEEYTQALGLVVAGGWRQVALGKRLGVPQALGLSTQDWVDNRLGGYVRLSIAERREAAKELTEEGMSQRAVAEVLGVDEKTVRNDRGAENSAPPASDQGTASPSADNSAPDPDDPPIEWTDEDDAEAEHWLAKGRIPPGYEKVEPDEPTGRRLDPMYSSATDDWATPIKFFDLLDAEFHFTLDVCASADNAKCDAYFTEDDNGLAQPWTGTCWMNPPYGAVIAEWMKKAHRAASGGDCTVVCLVPARTDTGWWWNHARHGEVRFVRGRLHFGDAGAAPFPNAVVIFGRRPKVVWWEGWPA